MKAISNFLKPSNRSLIRELVVTDFKLRYQGSVLGYVWSLLKPLMLFGVLYIVFTKVIRFGDSIPFYPAYLLLGLVLWSFFTEATVNGMNAITGRGDLIRKVSVPKYIIVFSTTISALINLGLNLIVVFVFMILSGVPITDRIILAIPVIGELMILSLGLAFLLATLFVKFRDIGHIWEVALQALFYATPILYPMQFVPERLREVLSINPLAQIFQDIRAAMITPETITTREVFQSQFGRWLPLLAVLVIAVLSALYFRRNSRNFAEEL